MVDATETDTHDTMQAIEAMAADNAEESTPLLATEGGGRRASQDEEEYLRDFQELPWHHRPTIFWLLPPFCLFAMAFGGVVVPKLNIILDLICRKYFLDKENLSGRAVQIVMPIVGGGDNQQCHSPEVQSRTSIFVLAYGLVSGLISVFTSPRLGSLSDRYGRKNLMTYSSSGLLIAEVFTVLAAKFPQYFTVNIFLVGAMVDGLCGSFMLAMALAYSYGADCTYPKHRAVAFGALQGCMFFGIAAGPVLGGLLVEATGNMLSIFYVAMLIYAVFVLYIVLVLPESLSKRRQLEARAAHTRMNQQQYSKHWISHFSPRAVIEPLAILFPTGSGTSTRLRLNLGFLAAIDFILFGVGLGGMAVLILYAEKTFGWGNLGSSVYLSVVNSARVAMLLVVLPLVSHCVRRNRAEYHGSDALDINLIRFAIIVEAAGYFGYSVAPTGAVFTLFGAFAALGGVGSPTVQSSLTKHVPKNKTGQLLGALSLLHSLARVVAPAVFNLIYAKTVGTVPQTVFVCLSSTFGVAFICSWFIKAGLRWQDEAGADEREDGAREAHVVVEE